MQRGRIRDVPRAVQAWEDMVLSVQAMCRRGEGGQPILPVRRHMERVATRVVKRATHLFLGAYPNDRSLRFGCLPKFKIAAHERPQIPSRLHRAFVGLHLL